VRDTLRAWELAGQAWAQLVDDAVLLTSELVTNAVLHAGTPVQVVCRLLLDGAPASYPVDLPPDAEDDPSGDWQGASVEIAVLDWRPAPLRPGPPRTADEAAEHVNGRGLLLPYELASAWGVTYARAAKAVWFRMAVPDPALSAVVPGSSPGSDSAPLGAA
jgi:hypothetical protein